MRGLERRMVVVAVSTRSAISLRESVLAGKGLTSVANISAL
jgi:hypothetical protein